MEQFNLPYISDWPMRQGFLGLHFYILLPHLLGTTIIAAVGASLVRRWLYVSRIGAADGNVVTVGRDSSRARLWPHAAVSGEAPCMTTARTWLRQEELLLSSPYKAASFSSAANKELLIHKLTSTRDCCCCTQLLCSTSLKEKLLPHTKTFLY